MFYDYNLKNGCFVPFCAQKFLKILKIYEFHPNKKCEPPLMLRRRSFIFLLLVFLVLFVITTNYLLITLHSKSEVKSPLTVEEKIYFELNKLPGRYTSKSLVEDKTTEVFLQNLSTTNLRLEDLDLEGLWAEANSWVSKTQLVNLSSPDLGKLFFALKHARITKADVDTRGTQLKLLFTLEGNQHVVFKPQWYEKERVIEGPVYAGKDRYGSEIVSFYLSVLFKRPLTPMSVQRTVSLTKEIIPVAEKRLLDTVFERNNKTCFYGKCFYCKISDPVCTNEHSLLNGAVIFNFKALLNNYRSPWQRTYKKGKKALWQEFEGNYCKTVKEKLSKKRIYDLVDTAIFDFLIQNGDRHHYETLGDTVVWLDNGKGLGNPYVHHIDILAPLYQCCILRRETWKTLLELTGGRLREKLESMPDIHNVVTEDHLNAMEKRLLIIFATIEYCRHQKRIDHYLFFVPTFESIQARWKSTDTSSNSQLRTMPGPRITLDTEEILRGSLPISPATEKMLSVHYADDEESKQVQKLFARPKSVLKEFFDAVIRKTGKRSLSVRTEYKSVNVENRTAWICYIQTHWPGDVMFSAVDYLKSLASYKTAVAALVWLRSQAKITDRGQPVFDKEKEGVRKEIVKICYEDIAEVREAYKSLSPSTVYSIISKQVEMKPPFYQSQTSGGRTTWKCWYQICQPQEMKFVGEDTKKRLAEQKAASALLLWWQKENKPEHLEGVSTAEEAACVPNVKQKSKKASYWMSEYHMLWPEEIKFIALDSTEALSKRKAAATALAWLTNRPDVNKSELAQQTNVNIQPRSVETKSVPIPEIYFDDIVEASRVLEMYPSPEPILQKLYERLTRRIKNSSLPLHSGCMMLPCGSINYWVFWYHMLWPEEVKFVAVDFNKHSANRKASATVEEIYYQDDDRTSQVLIKFPAPKNVLHNVFDEISRQTGKKTYQVTPTYKLLKEGKKSAWLCTYHVHWPKEVKFQGRDTKKGIASHKAAVAALAWLRDNKKITSDGLPITFGKEEVKSITKKTLPVISLDQAAVDKIRNIVQLYQTQVAPRIKQGVEGLVEDEAVEDRRTKNVEKLNLRNVRRQKYLGLDKYRAKEKVELPIAAYKDDFKNLLQNNQIIIVKGQPGCGKSTRVPQYVLEAWAEESGLLGEPGRVVVTQPRRIAAISLAQRVAAERDEIVGDIVGYQVRLKHNFSPVNGKILYCTTGILLRHLQSDPNLSTFTHVILDEAHERDVNTDLLMNLLRSACKTNPKLKLVVMSATIDTAMFSEYFDGAPVMDIPGFTYPVVQHFLDECTKIDLSKTVSMCEGDIPTVVHQDVARVLQFIHERKKEGAVLCFLPGWEDINKVQKLIPARGDLVVYCLHSRLQDAEQWKIFSRPPPGVRKIILATNIAETSVTIDDIVYVVDTGIHKEHRFDIEKGVNCLDEHWISKASVQQRKGRAGRVQAGESFHLYTRDKYDSFADYSLPEIQRTSLTKIVLDSKVFSNNMNAIEFMSKLPTPPEENATLRAVEELQDLEMLDKDENLTSLGTTCADFQLEPKLSKALISAVIFKCVTPVIDIVTLFSADTEFFTSGLLRKDDIKKIKKLYCKDSDHLAMMRLFEKWLMHVEEGDSYSVRRFCQETNLVSYKMETIEKLREIHFDYLHKGLYDVLPISDNMSDNDEMVKAVLYSGVGTILQHRNWDIVKNKLKNNVTCLLTRNNHKATITMESVNHKRTRFPTNFLLYINETRSNIRRTTLIRECSLIPNISVLLFSHRDLKIKDIDKENFSPDISSTDQIKIGIADTNIEFLCDKAQAQDLIECKNAIMTVYRYYIKQLTDTGIPDEDVNRAWDSIVALVNGILSNERAFQKQPTVFLNRKRGAGPKKRKSLRYHREVGLGFKTPRETEKAFQKQPTVFLNRKAGAKKKQSRLSRNVGLGFKTPREAIEGSYIDKKCPFTGNVSIRGRILTGVVQKMKMQRTIVIRRDYLHYVRKYNRFEKRHRNMSVHLSPCFRDVEIGDVVTIGECRPLSKTVRFNVLKVTKGSSSKKSFKKF
ncbi:hypothetical protein NQ315_009826 [Exocentrus adspersus]|uniref:Small ribosomal subunit protein uS17 n=1 Tax=Exocentrus adspersus TaxID=1586481 RepID=A0AAV8WI79_9CUCU|nr:hypothetical protein NQ315_009826 [Exocentrus adspersus]